MDINRELVHIFGTKQPPLLGEVFPLHFEDWLLGLTHVFMDLAF